MDARRWIGRAKSGPALTDTAEGECGGSTMFGRESAVMDDAARERLRVTFGEDAELYDRCRPGYPPRLFDDLTALAGLSARSRVLEIGCGTGQATLPLAQLGCTVVAVELSPDMAGVARRNLAAYPNVTVVVSAFEDWQNRLGPFDLVMSATAFHWIDPDIRVVKAADVLAAGGTLAVISTHHVAGGTEAFFVDAQGCYERFDPDTPPGLRLQAAADIPQETTELDQSARFGPVEVHRYEWRHTYTTGEYLNLLRTYSGHRALPAQARGNLLACIAHLIDTNHGGQITKRYLIQLATTHKVR